MPSTVADRSLSGSDISVFTSPQTAKGSINVSPVFDQFRRLEGKPVQTVAYTNSNEVKSNRQARMQIQESTTNVAELSFELNEQTALYLDAMIHGAQVDNSVAAAITIASDADGFTDSGSGFTGLNVGDWIKVAGFVNTAINGFYRISVKNSDGDIEVLPVPPAVEAAGASVSMESQKTVSGSAPTYFTVQTRTLDKSAVGDLSHDTFVDGIINTGSLEIGETGIVTGALALNIETLLPGTAAIAGQTDAAIDVSSVVSSTNNITTIYVNGVDSACGVKSLGLEFNNNYQEDRSAACDGARYAFGDIELSGALVTRAIISNTFDWRSRYRNTTPFSLAFLVEFANSTRWMVIEIMQALVTDHSMPDGSNVIASNEMTYTAEEDDITKTTIQIFRNF